MAAKKELSRLERRFVKEYVKLGDHEKAALAAGYAPSSARKTSHEILARPHVKREIAKLTQRVLDEAKESDIAEMHEVLAFFTSTMRGELKDAYNMDPQLGDRIKAGQQLHKRYEAAERVKQEATLRQWLGVPAAVMGPAYADIYHAFIRQESNTYIMRGGRGSLKSSTAALMVIDALERNPNIHALAMRRYSNTLRDSVHAQLIWAINEMGLSWDYTHNVSPLLITKKSTGQHVYFRGADSPEKVKGITPEAGYIGVTWFEELDQFAGEQDLRNLKQSALRGGSIAISIETFNPPRSLSNWANGYADSRARSGALVLSTTYQTTPRAWLGDYFNEEAELLKELDFNAYQHEYLGIPIGHGANVFDNLELREITDEEVSSFDRRYFGVDWGWYPDPMHFSACYFEAQTRTLYVFDEFRKNKLPNEQLAAYINGRGDVDRLTCDKEEKSVADLRAHSINARTAEKGPGSVNYSMKWLSSLRKIVIDPARTPATAEEFKNYEHERTKSGELVSGYPDKNNHALDSVRYALESVWRRKGR